MTSRKPENTQQRTIRTITDYRSRTIQGTFYVAILIVNECVSQRLRDEQAERQTADLEKYHPLLVRAVL